LNRKGGAESKNTSFSTIPFVEEGVAAMAPPKVTPATTRTLVAEPS